MMLTLALGIGYLLLVAVWTLDSYISSRQAVSTTSAGTIVVGKPMGPLAFTAGDGREVNLADLKGKVVLVQFWASWCPPCAKEMPQVAGLYRRWHGLGFEIIGISLDHNAKTVADFTQQNGMTWPNYFDGKGWNNKLAEQFHVRSIPQAALVNRKGLVVGVNLNGEALAAAVEKQMAGQAMAAAEGDEVPTQLSTPATVEAPEYNWKATDVEGNTIEVVSIEPKSPASFKSLEKVSVRVKYHLASERPLQIFARPVTDTRGGTGPLTSGSNFLTSSKQAEGEVTRTIMYRYGATISGIVVSLYDREADKKEIITCRVPYSGIWGDGVPPVFPRAAMGEKSVTDAEGNTLELVSVEPNSPAVLKANETLTVRVRYKLTANVPVWISAHPYGKDKSAGRSLTSSPETYTKSRAESGQAVCTIAFREAAVIDGVTVEMGEANWGRSMARLRFPVEARWE